MNAIRPARKVDRLGDPVGWLSAGHAFLSRDNFRSRFWKLAFRTEHAPVIGSLRSENQGYFRNSLSNEWREQVVLS